MNQSLLEGVSVVELHVDPDRPSIGVGFAGTLLGLLGARVKRVELASLQAESGAAHDEHMEAFLRLEKAVERTGIEDLTLTLGKLGREPGYDVLLVGSEGPDAAARIAPVVEKCRAILRPAIVVCVTPFGLVGPKAAWAGSNLVALAAGGAAFYTPGWCFDEEHDRPLQLGEYAADLLSGTVAATSAISALNRRYDEGLGSVEVDISQQDAVLSMMITNFAWVTHQKLTPTRMANVGHGIPLVPFHCGDGLFSLAIGSDEHWKNWVQVMGSPDWAKESIFETREGRSQYWDILKSLIEEWAARHTKEYLWRAGQQAGVPVFPVYDISEVQKTSQLRDRSFFSAATIGTSGAIARLPLGVFRHVTESGHYNSNAHKSRPLRVLDFSWVLAGPRFTSWLGMMGANIVRVESARKMCTLRLNPPFLNGAFDINRSGLFFHVNQNRRSITLDLNHPRSLAVIQHLVKWADVIVENFYPGQMDNFGLSEATLRSINPSLIIISSSGLGGSGRDANVRAFGHAIHAYAGLTGRVGYAPHDVRGFAGTWADPLTGMFLTLVCSSAVLRRRRAGVGVTADVSMAEVTVIGTIVDVFVKSALGVLPAELPENRATTFCLNEVFRCKGDDQWVAVSARTGKEVDVLMGVLGLMRQGSIVGTQEEVAIAAAIRERGAGELSAALQLAGIAAHQVADAEGALMDSHPHERGTIVELERSGMKRLPLVALPWRELRDGRWSPPRVTAAPFLGEHTSSVLAEMGFTHSEITELFEAEVLL